MKQKYIQRKLSLATWKEPREGNIYGSLNLDVTQVQKYLEELREKSRLKITITHFIGKVIAEALEECPSMNSYVAWDRINPHQSVDVTFLVHMDNGNLGRVKVKNSNEKSVADISQELHDHVDNLRQEKDKDYASSVNLLKVLPVFLIRPMLKITSFLTTSLGWNVKALGLESHPFGSCMITNVGTFGIDEAYAPFTPFAKVPLLVLLGRVREMPVVEEGEIVVRPMIFMSATMDHRVADGYEISKLAKTIRKYFKHPWLLDSKLAHPNQK